MMVPEHLQSLARVIATQLEVFPDHERFLVRRFHGADAATLAFADDLAASIETICGERLREVCEDYRWLSGVILDEELFFRRNGRYRLTSFDEAEAGIYANRAYMARYCNGILASQLWWSNHTDSMRYFRDSFLAGAHPGSAHLEVGPGHGLLLAMAAGTAQCATVEGWDVSEASLTRTRDALARMGVDADRVVLRQIDIRSAPQGSFDSIAFSEVLEHVEDPLSALRTLRALLRPGGRIYINAPVNSPAPDHLFLFRHPEEVVEMVRAAGLSVRSTLFAPCSGSSLDRARRMQLTISAAIIAEVATEGPESP